MKVKSATVDESAVAKGVIKELGKSDTKDLIIEESLNKFLLDKFPGVTFHLSEIDEIEKEIKKRVMKPIKRKKAEFAEVDPNENSGMGYGGDRPGVAVEPARTMKLESANNYKIDTILELGNRKKVEQILNKLVEEKVISGYLRGADGKVIILNVSDVNKVKEVLKYPIVKSSEEKKEASTPKPTTDPGKGMIWGYDPETDSWIPVIKKASLEDIIVKGIISGIELEAGDGGEQWPGAAKSTTTGVNPGYYVQPKTDAAVESQPTEQTDEDLLKVGTEIEHEHLPTYNALIADVNSNGKITFNIDQVAALIAKDHINELGAKYYSNEQGLPELERRLSGVTETVNTEKEVETKTTVDAPKPADVAPEVKAPEQGAEVKPEQLNNV